jgi:hypothetical protein
VRAGDGNERRVIRHLEQGDARGGARDDQLVRDVGERLARTESDAGAEPEPDDATGGETIDVRDDAGVVILLVELRPGREEGEVIREERGRIGEVGGMHPAHRPIQCAFAHCVFTGDEAQAEIRAPQQRAQRRLVHEHLRYTCG